MKVTFEKGQTINGRYNQINLTEYTEINKPDNDIEITLFHEDRDGIANLAWLSIQHNGKVIAEFSIDTKQGLEHIK